MANQQHIEWLLEGREAWNERREIDDFVPDFRDAHLLAEFERAKRLDRNESIPLSNYNLRGANLRGANLEGADVKSVKLPFGQYATSGNFTNLAHTIGLTQDKLGIMKGNTGTILPDGLHHPANWPEREKDEDEKTPGIVRELEIEKNEPNLDSDNREITAQDALTPSPSKQDALTKTLFLKQPTLVVHFGSTHLEHVGLLLRDLPTNNAFCQLGEREKEWFIEELERQRDQLTNLIELLKEGKNEEGYNIFQRFSKATKKAWEEKTSIKSISNALVSINYKTYRASLIALVLAIGGPEYAQLGIQILGGDNQEQAAPQESQRSSDGAGTSGTVENSSEATEKKTDNLDQTDT